VLHESEVTFDHTGRLRYALGTFQDITERRLSEERISYIARHDELTGLPNRSYFSHQLAQTVDLANRDDGSVVLLLIDIDNFSTVNESLGHQTGDLLLCQAADRFRLCIRGSDTIVRTDPPELSRTSYSQCTNSVARLGGDEFVILLGDVRELGDAESVIGRILKSFEKRFLIEDVELYVTFSIGISTYPWDKKNPDLLLRNAEIALNHAKRLGGNRHEYYNDRISQSTRRRFSIEAELRKDLARNNLQLYYQPKVQLSSNSAVGLESLVRWHHPVFGEVAPSEFIPIAEESGLIETLGEWALHTACEQAAEWIQDGFNELTVAVNLSPAQFRMKQLASQIEAILRTSKLEGRFLEVEITEGVLLRDTKSSLHTLEEIKNLGSRISVDDFGTGYSSLSYLKKFRVDSLKIDQSFVREIHGNSDDSAIVDAIIALGHSLNLTVVAEGVETIEQLKLLRQYKCDQIQGYLLGRPMAAEDTSRWMKDWQCNPSIADFQIVLPLSTSGLR
jgi:predicted signal transduction protein with EAL and GGDEF domain